MVMVLGRNIFGGRESSHLILSDSSKRFWRSRSASLLSGAGIMRGYGWRSLGLAIFPLTVMSYGYTKYFEIFFKSVIDLSKRKFNGPKTDSQRGAIIFVATYRERQILDYKKYLLKICPAPWTVTHTGTTIFNKDQREFIPWIPVDRKQARQAEFIVSRFGGVVASSRRRVALDTKKHVPSILTCAEKL